MAVTRSSSAKKVVRKAVAVKVTKSSGRKYVSWDDTCNQLIAFWKKEGHCCPHFSTMLGEWSSKQQQKFQANNPELSQERIEKLSTIGFQFCLQMETPKKYLSWNDRYNELVDHKNEHGHANPLFREGQLGRWCIYQRQIFQNQFRSTEKATLYQYQIDKLQSTTGQDYAATRQLAGHTGLAGLAGHASLTGYAYFASLAGHASLAGNAARPYFARHADFRHADFVILGDLARLCT